MRAFYIKAQGWELRTEEQGTQNAEVREKNAEQMNKDQGTRSNRQIQSYIGSSVYIYFLTQKLKRRVEESY